MDFFTFSDVSNEATRDAAREIHFVEEGAASSGGRSGSLPLLTRTDADPDPSDPRNYEEDPDSDWIFDDDDY